MKSGFFEKDITPPTGTWLDGWLSRTRPSDGVTDNLFLRILSLEDEKGERAIIVTADILWFPKDMSWRMKKWAANNLKIKSSSVILNSSHTHCGPYWFPNPVYPHRNVDVEYYRNMELSIMEGMKKSINNLSPSRFRFGILTSHFGINRRLPDKDNRIEMKANEEGYYDPDLPVLAICEEGKNTLKGLFYSYACHPSCKDGYSISANYPGAVSRALKNELGGDIYTLFAQGAGGDIKPRFYDKVKKDFIEASVEGVENLGRKVAEQIVSGLQSNKMQEIELDLASVEKEFCIPYDMSKVPNDKELWGFAFENNPVASLPSWKSVWARKLLEDKRTNRLEKYHVIHLTRIDLNEKVQIIGLSGEIVAELGRMIKDMYKDKSTIFLGYCNYVGTYIPIRRMIDEGGYEGLRCISEYLKPAPFVKEIDEIIRKEVMNL